MLLLFWGNTYNENISYHINMFSPTKIWKKITKIQRRFLWGRVKAKSKIARVKWDDVCKPKNQWGLDVHDLRLVNLALLGKWTWCLLLGAAGVLCDIVTTRYGVAPTTSIHGGRASCLQLASPCWKGVFLPGAKSNDTSSWFTNGLFLKDGYGILNSFLKDLWVENNPLCLKFPILFLFFDQTSKSVWEVGI